MKKFASAVASSIVLTISLHATPLLIDNLNEFATSFYETAYKEKEGNQLFSPYCLFNCLSMAYLGAEEETARQMEKALSISVSKDELALQMEHLSEILQADSAYQCNIGNSIWIDKNFSILPMYQNKIVEQFKAKAETLSFFEKEKAVSQINTWVSENTLGLIPNLLDSKDISVDTKIMLVSALYFKGDWQVPFQKYNTQKMAFHKTKDSTVLAHMMEQTSFLPYLETEIFQLAVLPFKSSSENTKMAFFVLLPQSSFSDLEEHFSTSSLFEWIALAERTRLKVQIPKFQVRLKSSLEPVLKSLGMQNAFSRKADFSGITGKQNLFLERVLHETYFSLNEEGATAAAATSASFAHFAMLKPPMARPFIANHPFMFGIVDLKSNVVLFLGKMIDPS